MVQSRLLATVVALSTVPVQSATVTYNWNVTWVTGSPDSFSRPIIGINNAWPCPIIESNVGDTVQVNLYNGLGNETTGIHFHGLRMVGYESYDGATGVSQCPLAPGHSMTYSFVTDFPGTYWWHSHNMAQYPEGLRGPLIVHDPNDPYSKDYEAPEQILTVSDWYHEQTRDLMSQMIQTNNTNDAPPLPASILVNEGGDNQTQVEAGKTYRLRLISFSAMSASFFVVDGHQIDIIMIDGTYVKRQPADQIRIPPGARYDVLITMAEDYVNPPFIFSLDTNPNYSDEAPAQPIQFNHNFTGNLVTDGSQPMHAQVPISKFKPQDDSALEAYDGQAPLDPVNQQWILNFDYCTDANGLPRSCFNGTTHIPQKVPTLYSAVSLGENNVNPSAYGQVNPFLVAKGSVLEIIINNLDTAIHPFHLHGHQFQIISRPPSNSGSYSFDSSSSSSSPPLPATTTPARRDVIDVWPRSHAVLRIKADNVGVWLLHCHVEWHVEMGLSATLIVGAEELRGVRIPQDHLDACAALGVPTSGNAAGNSAWDDVSGFVTVPDAVYKGAIYP